jgi:hypothetical protein
MCGLEEVISPQSQKDWVRKSQIHKVPHLRKVRKYNKLMSAKFADLQFAKLICGLPSFAMFSFHPRCQLTLCTVPQTMQSPYI